MMQSLFCSLTSTYFSQGSDIIYYILLIIKYEFLLFFFDIYDAIAMKDAVFKKKRKVSQYGQ